MSNKFNLWIFGIVIVLLFTQIGYADQAAYIEKIKAFEASKFVEPGSVIRMYCEPCGDETWEDVEVNVTRVNHTGYEDFYELQINGEGVDLAYTYVYHKDKWKNLAMLVGLDVQGVSEFIGETAVDPCEDAMTMIEMIDCAQERYQKADDELNEVYQELMSLLENERKELLREAQRAWLKFRDTTADFEASEVEGGSLYPLFHIDTLAFLTEKRVEYLKKVLDGVLMMGE